VKIKCLKRQEFVVGGFTEPSGSRKGFGALLLGYFEKGDLIYCGRVGTGFTEETLSMLSQRLFSLEQHEPPFKNPPTGREARGAHWISPQLVVDVEFTGWTDEEALRHPSYKGLREDKRPDEVALEKEESPAGDVPPVEKTEPARRGKNTARTMTSGKSSAKSKIAGVSLSNPDRILYPEQGVTKLQLALFYKEIADWILPHVVRRPLTLVRCPQGHQNECFYQKHLEEALPETMRGVTIREKEGEGIYIVIDDLPGLISLVQLGVLEIHPWGARDDDVERPDMMVFDLDPGPDVPWDAVIRAARLLHDRLDKLRLTNFLKTTGAKGLHVVVPLERRAGWEEVKAFSKALVEDVVKAEPHNYVATMSKAKRKGKIFIDYVRNSRGATSIAAYSTRARSGAPVSTPIGWNELSADLPSDAFNIHNLPARLRNLRKDPWESYFEVRQSIAQSMKTRLGIT
jgi:bifunctional non-homologous end joining protein LigD